MLSFIYAECRKQAHYAECHYAECRKQAHYAECHYAECRGASKSVPECHFLTGVDITKIVCAFLMQ
jgi:hypothetical protein